MTWSSTENIIVRECKTVSTKITNADIAKLYNVKPNLIGARISRALKKLQENSVFNKYMEELFGEQ